MRQDGGWGLKYCSKWVKEKNHQKGDLTPPSCPKIPKLGHLFALQSWRFQKLSKQPSVHGLHQRKSVNNKYKTLFKLKFATHKPLLESLLDQQINNGYASFFSLFLFFTNITGPLHFSHPKFPSGNLHPWRKRTVQKTP